MVPQSTPFGKYESHIEGNLHLRGRPLAGLLTELLTVLPAPCRAGVTLNRHFPDTEVVGRDLPSLGVPRQRNSIAADSLTAKTARCSAPLGRNSLLCVHQGAPLPSSAVASDLISRSRWCGRRPQLGDQHHVSQSVLTQSPRRREARNDCGIVRPSALAVLILMTSSNLVGCWTGRSAGLAPFRILST